VGRASSARTWPTPWWRGATRCGSWTTFSTAPANLAAVEAGARHRGGPDPRRGRAGGPPAGPSWCFHQGGPGLGPPQRGRPAGDARACPPGPCTSPGGPRSRGPRVIYGGPAPAPTATARPPVKSEADPTARCRRTPSRSWPASSTAPPSPRLRAGDGAAALLQRLRPAAAAGQPLLGGHPAVHRRPARGGSPVVHGDGRQSRDFTHVDNVVRATCWRPRHPAWREGLQRRLRRERLAAGAAGALNALWARGFRPAHTDPRPGDVRTAGPTSRARRAELGYAARSIWWKACAGPSPTTPPRRPARRGRLIRRFSSRRWTLRSGSFPMIHARNASKPLRRCLPRGSIPPAGARRPVAASSPASAAGPTWSGTSTSSGSSGPSRPTAARPPARALPHRVPERGRPERR